MVLLLLLLVRERQRNPSGSRLLAGRSLKHHVMMQSRAPSCVPRNTRFQHGKARTRAAPRVKTSQTRAVVKTGVRHLLLPSFVLVVQCEVVFPELSMGCNNSASEAPFAWETNVFQMKKRTEL